jgi:hypothetical protein
MLSLIAVLLAAPDAGALPVLQAFQWNVPQVDHTVEVGDKLEAKGLPLKIFLVHSKLSQQELFRHYYERFTREGFFVDPKQKALPSLSLLRLTAFDDRRLWSYTVIFYPERDGSTTLTLGAADMSVRQGGRTPAVGEGIPVLPGATSVLTTNVELGRSLSFETNDSADEVLSYYQATLPTLGWKERERGTFVQKGLRMRVLTRVQERQPGLQVVVLQDRDVELSGLVEKK